MTVRDIIKLLRTDEEITLYDVVNNTWRTGMITKEYIPTVYLDCEVIGLQTDTSMCGSTTVLELGIRQMEDTNNHG